MTDTISTAYQAVLDYAERGWAVIPLHWAVADGCSCATSPTSCGGTSAGKHPLRKGWAGGDRLSGADLYAIWGEESPQANVGIRTGVISGFWALDVDPKSGGFESLKKLIDDIGPLPTTFVTHTPSGGYHYYLAMPNWPIRNSANRELLRRYGPGLDIRGDGGQVVAAPSVTPHGRYTIRVDAPIAPAPEALLTLLRAVGDVSGPDAEPIEDLPAVVDLDPVAAARAQNYAQRTIEIVVAEYRDAVPGAGNDTLFRSACSVIEIAQSPWNTTTLAAAYRALHDACRARRAAHPYGGGQDDDEFEQVWRSARNRTVGQGRTLPASDDLAFDPFASSAADSLFVQMSMTSVGTEAATSVSNAPAGTTAEKSTRVEPRISTARDDDAPRAVEILATLPVEFYARRPWLSKLRRIAHERMVAPDAVLGSYLTIVASQMPAGLQLHTSLGSPATASLYAVVVGPSGAGKTAGTSVALDLYATEVKPKGLSTGQGIIESYYGEVRTQDPDTLKFTVERARTSANQLFILDEGKALAQIASKPADTTTTVLRTLWSGSGDGQPNATKELRRHLDARTYNIGFIVGMQPEIAAPLLGDTATGMAQRFLWFSVIDPTMELTDGSDQPFSEVLTHPVHSDYIQLPPPAFIGGSVTLDLTPMVMTLESSIRMRLRQNRLLINRGEVAVNEHDSQETVTLCKLAMIFAYLDGSNKVTEDTWDLATQVYGTSAAVRDQLLEMEERRLRDEKLVVAHDKARERQAVARYGNDQVDTIRTILGWVDTGRNTRRQITQNAKGARRELLSDVLSRLVESGHLKEIVGKNRQVTYERVTDWTP